MINQYIKICDPRHSHLISKNKWLVLDDSGIKDLLVEYYYDEKPKFSSEICRKYFPKIVEKKINRNIFSFFCIDIIENIINNLPYKYVTTVEKRFCRNLDNKWIIDGDRYFYDFENPIPILLWKWFGGDDDGYNIGWIQNLPYS